MNEIWESLFTEEKIRKKQESEKKEFLKKTELHQVQTVMSLVLLAIVYLLSIQLPALMAADAKQETEQKRVVVIDAGHGGNDPGKVAINKTLEKDINLAIALKLQAMLEEQGIQVVMTRTEDKGLYTETDTNKKMADMKARCKLIADTSPDVVVSIHQNSYSSESVKGAQVFYYTKSEQAKALAQSIQSTMVTQLDKTNKREAKPNSDYYLLLHTDCPSVIVECGFLSNRAEASKLETEDYQSQVAKAVMDGVLVYLQGNRIENQE